MKTEDILEHCDRAAKLFDEMASCVRVEPMRSSVAHDGLNVDHVPMANLLEGTMIRLYREQAEAVRQAAAMVRKATPERPPLSRLEYPGRIMALLHYHCYPSPIHDSPANTRWTREMLDAGLICPEKCCPSGYITTAKGKELIERLCRVPTAKPD